MKIVIVANGELGDTLAPDIKKADYIIGVDRAAYWLIERNITPHIALGDFDSTSDQELAIIKKRVKIFKEPPHPKYETDLELAVQHALSQQPHEIIMYGVLGSRLDQTLSAINILEQFLKAGISAKIKDANNEAFLLQSSATIEKSKYTYFSVLAHTEKIVVSIRGARYPLNRYTLQRTVSLGISNEIAKKQAQITIHSGLALIIQSRD